MQQPMLDLPDINRKLSASPFNRWLGIEAVAASGSAVELRVPWRTELEGGKGMTHGGIFACVIDAAAFAVMLASRGETGPTIDMRVDFHGNAIAGDFVVKAELLRAGSRISSADVRVTSAAGRLLASGRCVYIAAR
jgi:uncharacterized protein (TIGR00369 family)